MSKELEQVQLPKKVSDHQKLICRKQYFDPFTFLMTTWGLPALVIIPGVFLIVCRRTDCSILKTCSSSACPTNLPQCVIMRQPLEK